MGNGKARAGGGGGAYCKMRIKGLTIGATYSYFIDGTGAPGVTRATFFNSGAATAPLAPSGEPSPGTAPNYAGGAGGGRGALTAVGDTIYKGGNGGASTNIPLDGGGGGGGGAGSTGDGGDGTANTGSTPGAGGAAGTGVGGGAGGIGGHGTTGASPGGNGGAITGGAGGDGGLYNNHGTAYAVGKITITTVIH